MLAPHYDLPGLCDLRMFWELRAGMEAAQPPCVVSAGSEMGPKPELRPAGTMTMLTAWCGRLDDFVLAGDLYSSSGR